MLPAFCHVAAACAPRRRETQDLTSLRQKGKNWYFRHLTMWGHLGVCSQVTALTPWSPLKGHVLEGDVLTAIDGAKVANVPFEKV